jgi:CubicO group peptidase (beta-lactamase class C family)
MDPAVLAAIQGNVASLYPQVRSVLVVRHGYLVYEHYCQGMTAADGDNVSSVTKSVVSALVGIAMDEGKLKGLDQTVGELWPATSRPTPTRGLPGSPSSSC